jgi:hypothetical protein
MSQTTSTVHTGPTPHSRAPHSPRPEGGSATRALRNIVVVIGLLSTTAVAQSLDFVLSPGFWPDPHRVSYISGGQVNAFNLTDKYGYRCAGWIARMPDHVMTISRSFNYLRIHADSWGDVTLVLYNPRTGERFCDDTVGTPEIVMSNMTADEWWIYVGSYHRGEMHDYELAVTEFSQRIVGR